MDLPRIGVEIPTFGPDAGPEAVVTVATAVERLGFHSVSASERLLLPAPPNWSNDAGLPEWPVYDPIEMLTWAAAHTTRIRVGTGIVNSLFQSPIVLARRFATLDQLTGGRLDVGIGQGWLPEEFTAVGVPITRRGTGFEEHLEAMRACWGPDPVEHDGPRYRIPRSLVGPKPFRSHLPVFIGALAQPAIERAARIGDGFITALRDWDTTAQEIGWYRRAGGSGPVVLRLAPHDASADPADFAPAIVEDVRRAASIGVDEVHWGLNLFGVVPAAQVEVLEAVAATIAA